MSRMLELKHQTLFLSHQACKSFTFNNVQIEWIDILFENSGVVPFCPMHSHDWFEFNYVIQGSMSTSLGDGPLLPVPSGSFILIPPGVEHAHRYDPSSPHEGLCLRWRLIPNDHDITTNDEFDVFNKLNRLKYWKPYPTADEYGLSEMLEHILVSSETGEQAIIVQTSFLQILLLLAKLATSPNPTIWNSEQYAGDKLARKVDIFLNDLQDRELDVKKLSDSLHLSYAHMAREFKRYTGKTIVERMTEIRLNKAIEYLLNTTLSISTIAEKTGFSSVYYFSRVFKAKMNISPTQFRLNYHDDSPNTLTKKGSASKRAP